jgi:hypothetical protein
MGLFLNVISPPVSCSPDPTINFEPTNPEFSRFF